MAHTRAQKAIPGHPEAQKHPSHDTSPAEANSRALELRSTASISGQEDSISTGFPDTWQSVVRNDVLTHSITTLTPLRSGLDDLLGYIV
ncbi:unnamed protein product [Clonostachys rhizophaga]|uniref:Uncharacterized protein n=1 Tax=Clonostachys rhizophaga TaxID=160324 RepID=A0A9N9V5P5_9HYPO|nr:unnamed protein product [Clonostachys rhizophaga]